ncbi:pentatricopeptide repeat-containing protein At5g65560-like [Phalaenopsis equestris]|uniref:pentatricopeptide repeat-containing protein At5g65560-like n=1 Tax=Phalaenopsis equestris TaxID=78828 RepID=UPI0009E19114|nr:pentatricopeptide repeat-containing protein At5g65560-like [Phalaenopsis equestris]
MAPAPHFWSLDDMRFKNPRVCVRSCQLRIPWESTGKPYRRPELRESAGKLLLRFSKIVKQFSKQHSVPAPVIDDRPRHPHRFEYSKLMKEFKRAGQVDQVLRLLQEMKDFNLRPDMVCYTIIMDSLVMANRPEQALAIFEEMISTGLAPDTACCTVLVKLYSFYLKQFDSAHEVILWMKKFGCSPDTLTYTTLITGLCWDYRVEEAFRVLDSMADDECQPNVYTYTPIVYAFCCMGKLNDARNLVKAMISKGCFPNSATYNILIKAFCKIGAFDEVDELLEESKHNGWKPDEITYCTYMNGLCKWGEMDRTFQLLEIMLDNGLVPNAFTVNILLDCLCSGSMAWEAKLLLERSAELEWDADVINYNTVMSRLCDDGRFMAVLKLFTDMLKKGISTNAWTLSIVIHSLCKAGKLREAQHVLDIEDVATNEAAYCTLIQYFYVAGKVHEVSLLFSKMVKGNIFPNSSTYSILIDCFCQQGNYWQAIYCFLRSFEQGSSQGLVARLIYWLVSAGRVRLVLYLIEQILEQGVVMESYIYNSFIKVCCKMGYCQSKEVYNICCILDRMLSFR